jgi:hypothetical protein
LAGLLLHLLGQEETAMTTHQATNGDHTPGSPGEILSMVVLMLMLAAVIVLLAFSMADSINNPVDHHYDMYLPHP